jgi:hypothetical protein
MIKREGGGMETVHVVIYCTVIGSNLGDRLRCVGISNRQEEASGLPQHTAAKNLERKTEQTARDDLYRAHYIRNMHPILQFRVLCLPHTYLKTCGLIQDTAC